ncbi:unnamed protein product, partial [Symbiodinium sp. CCMP2456]
MEHADKEMAILAAKEAAEVFGKETPDEEKSKASRRESDQELETNDGRKDTTWMLFADTQEHGIIQLLQQKAAQWQKLYQEKKVTTSLRVVLLIGVFQELSQRLTALMQDQDKLTKMHTVGWLVEGENALNPKWVYQQ